MTSYTTPHSLPIIEPAVDKIAASGKTNLAGDINALAQATNQAMEMLELTPGPVGPANVLRIGTVTTILDTAPASATITGEAPNQKLNMKIPRGIPSPDVAPTDSVIKALLETEGTEANAALGTAIEIGTLRNVPSLIGAALGKLRTGAGLTIVCRGDSTFYGHDTVSPDKVAPPSGALPDGSLHTDTRSPAPWPSVLQGNLLKVYPAVKVINQGYSGDWVGRGYDRWTAPTNADITIYGYGINDASSGSVPAGYKGNVSQYIKDLERMVERDLSWGSAVVFTTPMRQQGQGGTSSGQIIDSFRGALSSVADKYGIPLIDVQEFLTNAKRDAWSDSFHLTTKGNAIIGARMAALFIGGALLHKRDIQSGSKILPRLIDGWTMATSGSNSSMAGFYTPNDDQAGSGIAARLADNVTGTNDIGFVSFYATEADLVLFPYYFFTNNSAEIGSYFTFELDFGVEQGDQYHDHVIYASNTSAAPAPPAAVTSSTIMGTGNGYQRDAMTQGVALRVSTPGWHVLRVRGTRSNAATGLHFMAVEAIGWRDWQDMKMGRGSLHAARPDGQHSETVDISQEVIPWAPLVQRLGITPWTSHQYGAPILKLTVRTYGVGVVEYAILLTQRPDNSGADIAARNVGATGGEGPVSAIATELRAFNYLGASTTPKDNDQGRELESVAYRAADASLLLNWRTTNSTGGAAKNMKRAFEYQITVL